MEDTTVLMAEAVMRYAVKNYESGAWDVIVETVTIPELAEVVKGLDTLDSAVDHVRDFYGLDDLEDVRLDHYLEAKSGA